MAALFRNSSSRRFIFLKINLLSFAVVSLAVTLKVSAPVVVKFAIHEVPLLWEHAVSFFSPLYLYLVVNCIILTIMVSSKLQSMIADELPSTPPEDSAVVGMDSLVVHSDGFEFKSGKRSEFEHEGVISEATAINDDRQLESCRTPENNDPAEEYSSSTEKPLVSGRFGHRKLVRTIPDGGKSLGITKSKQHDTLENTWKKITEGRHMPLTSRLKKIEVSGSQRPQGDERKKASPNTSMDASSETGKLRKEASPGQDELNRRAEAFIKKFNEEMRMERMESLQRYKNMIELK